MKRIYKLLLLALMFFYAQASLAAGLPNGAVCAVGVNPQDSHASCASGYCSAGICAPIPGSAAVGAPINPKAVNTTPAANNTNKTTTNAAGSTSTNQVSPQAAPSGGTVYFSNPLNFTSVQDFLTHFLVALQQIIVTLALVAIVYGAVLYVIGGATDQIEEAKKIITAALTGLAIAIAAPSILRELSGILGWAPNDSTVASALPFSAIALRLLNFLLGTLGILALVMMIIGAIMYLSSAGDEDRIDKGKNIFKYSLIGLVLAMSSMILVKQIALFFSNGQSSGSTPITTSSDLTTTDGKIAPNAAPCVGKQDGTSCQFKLDSGYTFAGVCVSGICNQPSDNTANNTASTTGNTIQIYDNTRCIKAHPSFSCEDSSASSNPGGCVAGLCPGGSNIQCCPL